MIILFELPLESEEYTESMETSQYSLISLTTWCLHLIRVRNTLFMVFYLYGGIICISISCLELK